MGGADVRIEAVNGAYSFPIATTTVSGNLAATATAGETKTIIIEFNQRSGGATTTVRRLERR